MNIEELRSQVNSKFEEANKAIEAGELDRATEIKEEIKGLQAEIAKLEAELAEVEADKVEERAEEEATDKTDSVVAELEAKIKELEAKIKELQAELKQKEETQTEEKGEQRNMTNVIEEVVLDNKEEQRSAYQECLVTGEKRGVTTTDEGVLVPEEVSTTIENLMDELEGLDKLVDVKNVNNAIGKYPVRNADSAVAPLPTVAELEESPELGLRKLGDYKYEIKTFRGLVKAS